MSNRRLWWWTYAAFFLNGVATVILGPMLPRLQSLWGLGDGSGGALLSAQFLGMSLGSILVFRERRRALDVGAVCAWLGLSSIGILVLWGDHLSGRSPLLLLACAGFIVYGFGLGQMITALNLKVGAQSVLRQSRLSLGNAMWSAGAIFGPVLVSVAMRGHSLGVWLLGLAVSFPVIGVVGLRGDNAQSNLMAKTSETGTTLAGVAVFAALMFLYGGAESCLSSWVTTFVRRAGGSAVVSPLSTSAFWFGVAGGRAAAAALLRDWREREALLLLVGGAAIACVGLMFADSVGHIVAWAVVAGALVGPAFAVILAGLLDQQASARQTGAVLAMCGLGASVMPLLLGVLSQRGGSLRAALMLPAVCLVAMLALVLSLMGVPKQGRAGARG